MRTNVYRDKILRVLHTNHLLSISDIQKRIAQADYSTIYRNIEQMVSDGVLRKIVLDKNNVSYETTTPKNNHGHFLCLDCGGVESIQTQNMVGTVTGKQTIHDILVRGLCGKCHLKS